MIFIEFIQLTPVEALEKNNFQEEAQFVVDLGSSGVRLGGFKINAAQQIVEERIFDKKERILLQARIQNGILPDDAQKDTVIVLKNLLSEASIDPQRTKVCGFATAWARAAVNSQDLIEAIKSETGVNITIIDQKTEGKIGFHATLAMLRSSIFDKQSFLYQTDNGKEIRLKITGNQEFLNSEAVMSWDIGSGSMQLVKQNRDRTIEIIGSADSSTTFADAVIRKIKKQEASSNTPNPLSEEEAGQAFKLALRKAQKCVNDSFLQSTRSKDIVVVGLGLMHQSNRNYINSLLNIKFNEFYTRSDLERAAALLVGKDNGEIAHALGIKEVDARNRFTSMLLVLGFMEHLGIEKVNTSDVTGMTGVFFMDEDEWRKP